MRNDFSEVLQENDLLHRETCYITPFSNPMSTYVRNLNSEAITNILRPICLIDFIQTVKVIQYTVVYNVIIVSR